MIKGVKVMREERGEQEIEKEYERKSIADVLEVEKERRKKEQAEFEEQLAKMKGKTKCLKEGKET